MSKELEPPPRVFSPYKPRDQWIARVDNIAPPEKPDLYAGCRTPSDRLERLLDNAGSEIQGNFLLNRL